MKYEYGVRTITVKSAYTEKKETVWCRKLYDDYDLFMFDIKYLVFKLRMNGMTATGNELKFDEWVTVARAPHIEIRINIHKIEE